MSDDTEWGPWIEHDGRGCPVAKGTFVKTLQEDGESYEAPASGETFTRWTWSFCDMFGEPGLKIIRYRIRRPKALQQLIQMIENLPTPTKEREHV